jgi:hypothetical protein
VTAVVSALAPVAGALVAMMIEDGWMEGRKEGRKEENGVGDGTM